MAFVKTSITTLTLITLSFSSNLELDEALTLEKKPIIILPSKDANVGESIGNKITSILSQKATELGRFDVIDRRLIDSILEEQKLQNSGVFDENQIVQIGDLASAEEAFVVNIFEFGQKGVPKIKIKKDKEEYNDEKEETLSTWVVKTMVKATAKAITEDSRKRKQNLELDNNIQTIINGEVRMVNIASGISNKTFHFGSQFTGGNKAHSLNRTLFYISLQIGQKLRSFYSLTSEVISVKGGYEVDFLTGKDLGIKKGALFEIASIDKEKKYKNTLVIIPGKTRALARISNVGPNASRGKIIRKWRKVMPGLKAYEIMRLPRLTQTDFSYSSVPWYEVGYRYWFLPFNKLSISLNSQLGTIEDSRKINNVYFGLGSSLKFNLAYFFGVTPSFGINIPINFFIRRDDNQNSVSSYLISPSLNFNFSIQLGQFWDIVFSTEYVLNKVQSKWTYHARNENGEPYRQPGFWNNGDPFFPVNNQFCFKISLRKIKY